MGTRHTFYSGAVTLVFDWNETYEDDGRFSYAPILTATSSTPLGDPSIPMYWEIQVDGTVIDSGNDETSYYDLETTGTGPVQVDSYMRRYVNRDYNQTHTVRIIQNFTDWYGCTSKRLNVDTSITVAAKDYSIPAAPTAFTATKSSDSLANLAWTNNATTAAPYANVLIERSLNGGAFQQIASVSGSSTGYADTTVQSDGGYSYRVRATNQAGPSAYCAPSAIFYTTPAAPGTPIATKTGATEVTLQFSNAASASTSVEVQYSTNAGSTWSAAGTASAHAVTFIDTDAPTASAVIYRVRNVAGSVNGTWSQSSNTVAVLAKPNPATITLPSGTSAPAGGTVRLTWRFNPTDGSAQTAYKLSTSSDGSTWAPGSWVSSANEYADFSLASYASGTSFYWKVNTKGLSSDASDDSSIGMVLALQAPAITLTSPATNPYTLTSLPFSMAWTYTDASGYIQASAELRVLLGTSVVASKAIQGNATSITLDEWQPTNGQQYTASLHAISSSGLSASSTVTANVSYAAPPIPSATLVYGAAKSVAVTVNAGTGTPATDHLALYRVVDGAEVMLADNLSSGDSVTDALPPMDKAFNYKVVAYSNADIPSYYLKPCTVRSNGCCVINYDGGSVTMQYDCSVSDGYQRGGTLWWPAGASRPTYIGNSMRPIAYSVSCTAVDTGIDEMRSFASNRPHVMDFRAPSGIVERVACTDISIEQRNARLASVRMSLTAVAR